MLWNVWTQSPEEKTISMYVFSLAEKNSTIINMTCLRFLHTKRKKWEEPHSGCLSSRPRVKDKQTKALESMRRTSAFHRSWGLSSHPCGPKAMWELKGKGQGLGPFFFFFFYVETQRVRWRRVQNTTCTVLLPETGHERGWAPGGGYYVSVLGLLSHLLQECPSLLQSVGGFP